MKIVIEASSMAELRALLEEMTGTPTMAPKNVNPPPVFSADLAKTARKVAETYTVEGIGGTFSTAGEKPKKEKKEKPAPEPAHEYKDAPTLPLLTREDVLAKIKVVKAGPDPDIAEKVKAWLSKAGVEKLADCSNEQFHSLVKELKL